MKYTATRFVEAEVHEEMSKSGGPAAREPARRRRTEAPSFVLLAARNGRMLPIIHAAGRTVNYDCRVHHRPRAHISSPGKVALVQSFAWLSNYARCRRFPLKRRATGCRIRKYDIPVEISQITLA